MKVAFISDLHLCPKTHKHNQVFFELLSKWQSQLDALYILGDFFDYWLGDDDHNDFINQIKASLRKFTQQKPIYFIGGNHDFVVGRAFAHDTGIKLIADLTTIKIGDNNILLSHGDSFCTKDIKYQKMKRILQNKVLMFILLRTPLSWRYKIKQTLEQKSEKGFNQLPEDTYMVVDETIAQMAQQKNANVVIHGHTHRPGKYLVNSDNSVITRYEIPDWADHQPGGYVLADDNSISVINI